MASYRIHQSLVSKPLKIEQYWPLESDKKTIANNKPFTMTAEERDRILKFHQGS